MKNQNSLLFATAVVFGIFICTGASAKTAKDCKTEWQADKAGMQARGTKLLSKQRVGVHLTTDARSHTLSPPNVCYVAPSAETVWMKEKSSPSFPPTAVSSPQYYGLPMACARRPLAIP